MTYLHVASIFAVVCALMAGGCAAMSRESDGPAAYRAFAGLLLVSAFVFALIAELTQ